MCIHSLLPGTGTSQLQFDAIFFRINIDAYYFNHLLSFFNQNLIPFPMSLFNLKDSCI